ncbi:MAG TPA: hypothetical protein PLA90_12850 [Candidatus Sumerlaeota bacterium]|nr:hypothetical protein [Candidatus Sumerlaeota bacterium]HPS02419.1 hypothetical protein [Candidatus Sumerlaeota bacterium]
MAYPPLLCLANEVAYRAHFEKLYCREPVETFDGIQVRFRKRDFDHCCFESSQRNNRKDLFSTKRAERLDWIQAALQDPNSERYQGWDKKKKCYDATRRVTLVMGDYVVVIALKAPKEADFITAYVADTPTRPERLSTIDQIRKGPKWP